MGSLLKDLKAFAVLFHAFFRAFSIAEMLYGTLSASLKERIRRAGRLLENYTELRFLAHRHGACTSAFSSVASWFSAATTCKSASNPICMPMPLPLHPQAQRRPWRTIACHRRPRNHSPHPRPCSPAALASNEAASRLLSRWRGCHWPQDVYDIRPRDLRR